MMNNRPLRITALALALPIAIPLGLTLGVIYLFSFGVVLWVRVVKALLGANK